MHYWWYFMRFRASYKRVYKRPVIDPANKRVPGLRPWRPGPTLSPEPTSVVLNGFHTIMTKHIVFAYYVKCKHKTLKYLMVIPLLFSLPHSYLIYDMIKMLYCPVILDKIRWTVHYIVKKMVK